MISALIREFRVRSAHDLSEGGFAVALAECCFGNLHRGPIGANVQVPSRFEVCRDLFGEFPTRVLLSTDDGPALAQRAVEAGMVAHEIGAVGGDRFVLNYESACAIDLSICEIEDAWQDGLESLLENRSRFG